MTSSTPPGPARLADVNAMDAAAFLKLFGGVFEHSSWVAERAWAKKPFASIDALHAAMADAVRQASYEEQLALIRVHPELAGKEAQQGTLTAASTHEQKSGGLTELRRDEMERISQLNRDYAAKHGHPFIIAVRLNTKAQIFSEFERRLASDSRTEFAACLEQIYLITRLRLEALLGDR